MCLAGPHWQQQQRAKERPANAAGNPCAGRRPNLAAEEIPDVVTTEQSEMNLRELCVWQTLRELP